MERTALARYLRTYRPDLWGKIASLDKAHSLPILNEASGLQVAASEPFLPSCGRFLAAFEQQDREKECTD